MTQISFYQKHLDRVSRSFSFCIARLDGDMREWVSLSYLLCRILDTVEDAPWASRERQDDAFALFHDFLENPPSEEQTRRWADSFPRGTDPGELLLVQEAHRCFANLHALPAEVGGKIRRPVKNMYRGMRHFLGEMRDRGSLRLKTLAEVNQYCFFVAGLVGELLTELLLLRQPQVGLSPRLLLDAHHFGLFLQKINLLKDQAKDEKEGRFLVPSRKELLASIGRDADGAIRYIQALPLGEKGFRLFCAWSLFLGLASLPWIERSSLLGKFLKIPRFLTEKLLARVEKIIDDNSALARLFAEMLPRLPTLKSHGLPHAAIPWIEKLYEGRLHQEEFRELGMLPARG